jgi:hypothetical protein
VQIVGDSIDSSHFAILLQKGLKNKFKLEREREKEREKKRERERERA